MKESLYLTFFYGAAGMNVYLSKFYKKKKKKKTIWGNSLNSGVRDNQGKVYTILFQVTGNGNEWLYKLFQICLHKREWCRLVKLLFMLILFKFESGWWNKDVEDAITAKPQAFNPKCANRNKSRLLFLVC